MTNCGLILILLVTFALLVFFLKINVDITGWWYWKKYGICPIHLTMARHGGGYTPDWICDKCDEENKHKHENRISKYIEERKHALDVVRKSQVKQYHSILKRKGIS